MAEPWRLHRPAPNLCPFCSSPHFPFCPPPPQHPPPDPFYAPFRPPPPPPMMHNDFSDPHLPHNIKRPRLDDQFPHFEGRLPFVDERRIGLIRDHGGPVGFTPPPMARPWDNNQLDGGYSRDFPRNGPGNWDGARVSERNFTNLSGDYRGGSFRENEFESRNPGFGGNFVGGYGDGGSDRRLDFDAGQAVLNPSSNYGTPGIHERYGYSIQEQFGQSRDVVGQYSEPTAYRYRGQEQVGHPRDVVGQYSEPTAYRPSGNMHTPYSQPFENKYELPEQHHGVRRNYSEVISYTTRPFEMEANRIDEFGEGSYASLPGGRSGNSVASGMDDRLRGSDLYHPLLSVPVPDGHPEAPQQSCIQVSNSSPLAPKTLFPVLPSSSSAASFTLSAHVVPEPRTLQRPNSYSVPPVYSSSEVVLEGLPLSHHTPPKLYHDERSPKVVIDRPLQSMATVIDAYSLFKPPHRTSRPDHIVIILRGLPGSGKSYLAKALRDLEIENGGNAPRIHAMDDYFMVEVEKKVEENDGSRSSSSSRMKRQMTKKVVEYCYEPDMEEEYRSSMLKAFTKTIDEGIFTFIIVDDRNLRVADFAQFWAIAKRSGYEVYLLEAPYKDPTGCAARNVHGFTLDDVQKMSEQWEEAPVMYLRLDTQSLFRGDNLNEDSIQEVDMDTDDDELPNFQDKEGTKQDEAIAVDYKPDQVGERWDSEGEEEEKEKENDTSKVKDLGSSKWSKDFDEEIENKESNKQNVNALSGLIQSYSKKSVHWCDQAGKNGFSIGAVKKLTASLIIGPGSGYNFMSNPVIDDNDEGSEAVGNSYTKKKFNDQLRAESESFRAVFDKRRHRIGGFNNAEDD